MVHRLSVERQGTLGERAASAQRQGLAIAFAPTRPRQGSPTAPAGCARAASRPVLARLCRELANANGKAIALLTVT